MIYIYLDKTILVMGRVAKKGRSNQLKRIYYRDISSQDAIAIVEDIAAGLKQIRGDSRSVYLLCPSKYSITKNIEVPSFDPQEISDILLLQASRQTPFSKEELICDYLSVDVVHNRFTKVLLTILSSTHLKENFEYLQLANLDIEKVHIGFDALVTGLARSGVIGTNDPVGIVNVEQDYTDFIIVQNKKASYTRSIAIGSKILSAGNEQDRQALLDEIAKSFESFSEHEGEIKPSKFLFMTPAFPGISDFQSQASQKVELPFQTIQAQDHVQVSDDAAEVLNGNNNVSFNSFLLGATSVDDIQMDLASEGLKTQRKLKNSARRVHQLTVLSSITFVAFLAIFLVQIGFKNIYLNELNSQFKDKSLEAQKIEQIGHQNNAAHEFLMDKHMVLKSINDLEKTLPDDIYISEYSYSEGGKIFIKGTAQLMSSVFAYVTKLENDPIFKNAKNEFAKKRKEDDRDVTDFGILVEIDEAGIL